MLRNAEINNVMNTILGKLTPLSAKSQNYELWSIHDQLQQWKCAIEWAHPGIGADHSAAIAETLLKKLETLSDRKLAQEIEQIVTPKAH